MTHILFFSETKCSFPYTYNGELLFRCVNINMYNQSGWNCLTGNRSVIDCDANVKGKQYIYNYKSFKTQLLCDIKLEKNKSFKGAA